MIADRCSPPVKQQTKGRWSGSQPYCHFPFKAARLWCTIWRVRSADDTADRIWIVLGEDGKFVTLGRATSPSEAEISRVEDGLRAQGLAGWLAVMSGSPYLARSPTLLVVRPLAAPKGRFDADARTFRAVRRRALTPHQSLKP